LDAFSPRIAALTADELAEFLAKHACRKLDAACAGGTDDGRAPLSSAWDEIDRGRKAEREGLRHPLTDFEFKIDLFPVGSNVYGMIRTERAHWRDYLLSEHSPDVCEFAYWDNTDPPDEITASEWKSREKVWDHIWTTMIRGRISGGCTIDLSRRLDAPKPGQIMAKLPDLATRLDRIVKDRGVEHFLLHESGEGTTSDDRIRAVMRAPDWIKGPAGQAWIADERLRLSEILISEIKLEDLRRPPVVAVSAPRP
jgi:hypothetical protein